MLIKLGDVVHVVLYRPNWNAAILGVVIDIRDDNTSLRRYKIRDIKTDIVYSCNPEYCKLISLPELDRLVLGL